MNKTNQMHLWAFEPAATPATTRKPGATRGMDIEAAATLVGQHPDYRVLRRLVPREDWGQPGDGPTSRVLLLDTETTGLDARQERVIELALLSVQVDQGSGQPVGPVRSYASFEDPGKPIPAAIQEITGIDDHMVRGQRIDDAQVQQLVQQADLVVAHNAGFDRPFVEQRLPVFVDCAWACSFAGIDWKREGRGSSKLEFLAGEAGWFYDAHRALVDCHALLQVLTVPLSDGRTGLQHLIAQADGVRYKLQAMGAPFEAKDSLKARAYRWDSEARVWWTSLRSKEALDQECHWLKSAVYGGRSVRVRLEEQDARVQFSARPGVVSQRLL